MNKPSKIPSATCLLLIACTALASYFLLQHNVVAQSDSNNTLIDSNACSQNDLLVSGDNSSWSNSCNQLIGSNSYWSTDVIDAPINYSGRIFIGAGSHVILQRDFDLGYAPLCLGSNSILDLGGTVQVASSLLLENGTQISEGSISITDQEAPGIWRNNKFENAPALSNSETIENLLHFYGSNSEKFIDSHSNTITIIKLNGHLVMPSINLDNHAKIINGTLVCSNPEIYFQH